MLNICSAVSCLKQQCQVLVRYSLKKHVDTQYRTHPFPRFVYTAAFSNRLISNMGRGVEFDDDVNAL